jgi:hypothetical protein
MASRTGAASRVLAQPEIPSNAIKAHKTQNRFN